MNPSPINDVHENLDYLMSIIQDKQNNAESGQDCPSTFRNESTSREGTTSYEVCMDDQSTKYEERQENVQIHNNNRKCSTQCDEHIDKSNEHGSDENVLENIRKMQIIERNLMEQSVHGKQLTIEQQATHNKSKEFKDIVTVLLSKGVYDNNDNNSMLPDQQQHTIQQNISSEPFQNLVYPLNISSQTQYLPDTSRQGQYTSSFASPRINVNNLFQFQDINDYDLDDYNNFTHDKDKKLKLQIPPIYLYDYSNYDDIFKSLSKKTPDDYTISYTHDSIKLVLSSVQDYRSVIEFFETNKVKYLTFKYPIEDPLSMVIYNIPIHVSEELVLTELKTLKYDVVSVTRLNNRYLYPLPIVGVLLAKPAIKICTIKRLLNYDVSIEPRKPSNITPPSSTNSQKLFQIKQCRCGTYFNASQHK